MAVLRFRAPSVASANGTAIVAFQLSARGALCVSMRENAPEFPADLVLDEPGRGARLVEEFYRQYHVGDDDVNADRQHVSAKAAFFRERLQTLGHGEGSLGLDAGCRTGLLIKSVGVLRWLGIDLDEQALHAARASGIACRRMDFTFDLRLQDQSFDAVMMTEVLEHLPYPMIIVREVHRVLKQRASSAFIGSVPLDYHLHRRWKVLRGKRLSGDQTHVHHFSFHELDQLLRFFFEKVDYLPLSGTATRHHWLRSWPNLFIRDIAWIASAPKEQVGQWGVGKM